MTVAFNASHPLRIARSIQIHTNPKVPLRAASSTPAAVMKIDAHVHVWDPKFPPHRDHPLPPSLSGTANDLLQNMDAAGVDKTIIVQPINYKFDHACVSDAVQRYPTRFAVVALADTTLGPAEACAELERGVLHNGFRGVRLNPTFTPAGFAGDTAIALVQKAGELDVPVALFARPQHLDDVAKLLERFPETKILLDHFAFCTPGEEDEARDKVLSMGRQFPHLYVKTSAWFRVSKELWPHRDLHGYLRGLLDAFGPTRMLIGSDYPFVKQQYDYSQAFSLLSEAPLSDEDRECILGTTAAKLYKL